MALQIAAASPCGRAMPWSAQRKDQTSGGGAGSEQAIRPSDRDGVGAWPNSDRMNDDRYRQFRRCRRYRVAGQMGDGADRTKIERRCRWTHRRCRGVRHRCRAGVVCERELQRAPEGPADFDPMRVNWIASASSAHHASIRTLVRTQRMQVEIPVAGLYQFQTMTVAPQNQLCQCLGAAAKLIMNRPPTPRLLRRLRRSALTRSVRPSCHAS
jgi:hypothetical protein